MILIVETCQPNTFLTPPIPQKPDLSCIYSYRIASTRPSSGTLSCPHDSRVKQKFAGRAAIARAHLHTPGLRRPWHVDCLISGSNRAARHGTTITDGGPLFNQFECKLVLEIGAGIRHLGVRLRDSTASILRTKYARVADYGLPVMVTELGVDGSDARKREALDEFQRSLRQYPLLKAIFYFNAADTPGAWPSHYVPDWRIARAFLQAQVVAK
ncbi:hypothetical protein [Burkholderia pyrrocinia]|uniref:hypothetical protein n=1 Tax=Burkholderia pyrrocinia TaxID=60550 RepID=UPI001F2FA943|nr:hypothetical protein [Burkholderia pyrrocinia]